MEPYSWVLCSHTQLFQNILEHVLKKNLETQLLLFLPCLPLWDSPGPRFRVMPSREFQAVGCLWWLSGGLM